MRRRLIVTVDDFGLAIPVNEAVERGHREGIVTAASLMVAEQAAADAVARAKANPTLAVGLHVVVVAGRPVLPPERIPDLVGRDGLFSSELARAGVRYFFRRAAQRQLEAEIRAQFAAFAATGLRVRPRERAVPLPSPSDGARADLEGRARLRPPADARPRRAGARRAAGAVPRV